MCFVHVIVLEDICCCQARQQCDEWQRHANERQFAYAQVEEQQHVPERVVHRFVGGLDDGGLGGHVARPCKPPTLGPWGRGRAQHLSTETHATRNDDDDDKDHDHDDDDGQTESRYFSNVHWVIKRGVPASRCHPPTSRDVVIARPSPPCLLLRRAR